MAEQRRRGPAPRFTERLVTGFDPEQVEALRALADARRTTVAAEVRAAVDAHLARAQADGPAGAGPADVVR